MAATKSEAIRVIMLAARSTRTSQAEINRVIRACKTLGLDRAETIETLSALDYCDTGGTPYRPSAFQIQL